MNTDQQRTDSGRLPPGQRPGDAFPRFGAVFRGAVPRPPSPAVLRVSGAVGSPREIALAELDAFPRVTRISDLHCVTTWTKEGLEWSGWPLREVYERLIVPRAQPRDGIRYLVFFGLDGYRCTLALEDALADGVMLADRLDGEPLSAMHGAPLRLVSPRQYAYKSLKHVCGVGLRHEPAGGLRFGLEHPRGRVDRQERHARLPAWLVRLPYRALIPGVVSRLRRRMTSSDMVGRPTLLDDLLPRFDESELHDIWLDAEPAEVEQALTAVTGREVRLLSPLMALRTLPAWLLGRPRKSDDRQQPLLEAMVRAGFVRLAEEPGREIVLGVAGRFWRLTGNAPVAAIGDREAFLGFNEPGYARAAMSFLIRREGRGSRLVTETRIAATDEKARRSFRRYWRVIRPGSAAIRRSWLAAVRRRLLAVDH